MSVDYISQLPMWRWVQERYADNKNTAFPGGGKTDYVSLFMAAHSYLNESVHPTVQNRAALEDQDVYLTDHGPRHIEVVMRRASRLIQAKDSVASGAGSHSTYSPCLDPYEVFLLVLAIHFHDVGNMYGRAGHEERIKAVMEKIGPLHPLGWHERHLIARIAASHGGRVLGDKDTIRHLDAGSQHDGEVRYRPQLIAGVLRLADELADEASRADNFGLLSPDKLPETCLLYHKYASGLRVSPAGIDGRIGLHFSLHADDLRGTFKRAMSGGSHQDIYLLDEIYARTLKTYNETRYCGRFLRELEILPVEVGVTIEIFESPRHSDPLRRIFYIIGDSHYPNSGVADLASLARGFAEAPSGSALAVTLPPKLG